MMSSRCDKTQTRSSAGEKTENYHTVGRGRRSDAGKRVVAKKPKNAFCATTETLKLETADESCFEFTDHTRHLNYFPLERVTLGGYNNSR